jgi:putative sigma-54 modulation protein
LAIATGAGAWGSAPRTTLGAGAWGSAPRTTLSRVSPRARTTMVNVVISGSNFDVSDSLKDYVNEKIGAVLSKLDDGQITRCDAHLSVIKNARVAASDTCEVVVISKGTVIRAAERTESMYASIDLVAGLLSRKLRKLKERRQDKTAVSTAAIFDDTIGEPTNNSPASSDIVKRKKFPTPAQTVDDAIVCMGFIDHDFYVFENADTKEINVIYKRKGGGLGLIEPDR